MRVEINTKGANRLVILTRRHAFKLPNLLGGWWAVLWGLIDNIQERRANGRVRRWPGPAQDGICPLLFSLPGGFLNVMPRARPLTDLEWATFDYAAHVNRGAYWISAEHKRDSFGVLDGAIVAIDYGN